MSLEPIAVTIDGLHRLGVSEELSAPPRAAPELEGPGPQEPVLSSVSLPTPEGAPVPVQSPVWTVEAVRRLGMTTDVTTAAQILGIGRTLAFDLVRTDRFPVRCLRLGARIVVPVPELLRLVGVPDPAPHP